MNERSPSDFSVFGPARMAASATLLMLSACASGPQLDAQWRDPNLAGGFLRGARVLVACDAAEVVIRQVCQDQLASEVVSRGGTPVFVPPETPLVTDRSIDAQLLPTARSAGVSAMLVVTVAVAVNDPPTRPAWKANEVARPDESVMTTAEFDPPANVPAAVGR